MGSGYFDEGDWGVKGGKNRSKGRSKSGYFDEEEEPSCCRPAYERREYRTQGNGPLISQRKQSFGQSARRWMGKHPILTFIGGSIALTVLLRACTGGCSSMALAEEREKYAAPLAECLSDKGAVMYGTDSCGYCDKQMEAFGEDFSRIEYVNCSRDKNVCDKAGVQSYPTWNIGGVNSSGYKSLSELDRLAGCGVAHRKRL